MSTADASLEGAQGCELGSPIRGPSAIGGQPRRFLTLTWTLAILEFRLKFMGSMLGYLWQLGRPLLTFGVLLVVFTQFVRIGEGVPFYAIVLLTGIVVHGFFGDATGYAVKSVITNENLVRKVQFPRLAIPLSVVVLAGLNAAINFVAVAIFALAMGVTPHWSWFELVPVLLFLVVLCTGLAMLLSALYVRFRDIEPIWQVITMATFYATPILYPIEIVPSVTLQHAIMMSPLAVVVQELRHAVIDPSAASAAEAIGGTVWLLVPFGITVALFVIGFLVFRRSAPQIAEQL